MLEFGVVALLVATVVAVPALVSVIAWNVPLGLGVTLVVLGIVVGVPAGIVYHLRLYRALHPASGWWLHPTALHTQLSDAQRTGVMRWFRVGALSFILAIVGCALAALGAARI
jgi:hypothetical protein